MTHDLNPDPGGAQIRLSPDAALVLFELLSRWSSDEGASTPDEACFESPAEIGVLHGLLAELETQLSPPFQADYPLLLKHARDRLRDTWSGRTLRA